MHLVKVKKKVFKREFLDFRMICVVFDVCEMSNEDQDTVININRIFWVFPTVKGLEEELGIENMITSMIK